MPRTPHPYCYCDEVYKSRAKAVSGSAVSRRNCQFCILVNKLSKRLFHSIIFLEIQSAISVHISSILFVQKPLPLFPSYQSIPSFLNILFLLPCNKLIFILDFVFSCPLCLFFLLHCFLFDLFAFFRSKNLPSMFVCLSCFRTR